MSLKVRSGIRFVPRDFVKLHARIMEWREEVEELARRRMRRLVAEHATELVDRLALGLRLEDPLRDGVPDEDDFPAWFARRRIWDRQRDIVRTGRRDVEIDLGFQVWIFVRHGSFYGIVNTERHGWTKAFLRRPWVEDYWFGDGGDRPEGIAEAEWSRRERTWSGIFAGRSAPVSQCYTIDCVPDHVLVELDGELPEVPLEERVRRHAKDACLREWGNGREVTTESAFRFLRDFERWSGSVEGIAAIDGKAAGIRTVLEAIPPGSLTRSIADTRRLLGAA